jgi:hypothetical protein
MLSIGTDKSGGTYYPDLIGECVYSKDLKLGKEEDKRE